MVVRKSAAPAGQGEITLKRYPMFAHSFDFYEVQKAATPSGVTEP